MDYLQLWVLKLRLWNLAKNEAQRRLGLNAIYLSNHKVLKRSFSIQLTSDSGSASTLGRDPFSDFVTELLNATRDGSSSVLAAGGRK
jgi:hypothetical protein